MTELLKKLPLEIKKNKIKASLFIGLSAYWGIIIISTFIQFK